MATINLHGHLAAEFGDTFELQVESVAEAIRALEANFRGFLNALKPGYYRVLVNEAQIDEAGLKAPVSQFKTLDIVPVIAGAKGGGILGALAGVALIAAAVFVPGLQGFAAYAAGGLGAGLAISGLTSMLTPQPVDTNTNSREASRTDNRYFSNPENTEAQGRSVPIVIGLMRVGSRTISSSTVVE